MQPDDGCRTGRQVGVRIAIVGSGLAGTVLARCLHAAGSDVLVVERAHHPRFALGESSTPLAGICLERLARTYGLPDLAHLATHGATTRHLPGIGRGLKRGFTFFAHRSDRPFVADPHNSRRLLVAASPDDEVADLHWVRADLDSYLTQRAREEGVEVREGLEVTRVRRRAGAWRLDTRSDNRTGSIDADLIVDASGASAVLPRSLGHGLVYAAESLPTPDTGLIFGHFEGIRAFEECAQGSFSPGPYPDEAAAVHHLLDEGWMYVLPFDHGRVSAGLVLDRRSPSGSGLLRQDPEISWREVIGRYPSLSGQFDSARSVRPIGRRERLQRRFAAAAGADWALLPHTFTFLSPMFSTGIAWSLVAVERLATLLVRADGRAGSGDSVAADLARYGARLALEADHLARLITPAYRLRGRFDAFVAWSMLYFAAASYQEAWQRLGDRPADGWSSVGFLGATDPILRWGLGEAERVAPTVLISGIERWIAPRNLAGLADPARNRLYPVDNATLVAAAPILNLDPEEVVRRLPRLRSRGSARPPSNE